MAARIALVARVVALAVGVEPARAEDGWHSLAQALEGATGSVDVVVAASPSPESLGRLLDLLEGSGADQVRFSTTYDVAGRREVAAEVEAFAQARGLPWYLCRDWWLNPDHDWRTRLIRDQLGGSLVVLDNDPSSGVIENPDADLVEAMREDPAFAGVLGAGPQRVTDAEVYFEAVGAPWSQIQGRGPDPARQDQGGWVDGC